MLDGEGVVSDEMTDAFEPLLRVVSSLGVDLTDLSLLRNSLEPSCSLSCAAGRFSRLMLLNVLLGLLIEDADV